MADETQTCDHSICTCAVTDDDYCSPYCEAAGDSVELACNCGHPGCAAEV
jgi:hypothetical protein